MRNSVLALKIRRYYIAVTDNTEETQTQETQTQETQQATTPDIDYGKIEAKIGRASCRERV